MLPREHTVKPQNSHCAVCTASKYTAMNGIVYLSAGALLILWPGAVQAIFRDRAFAGDEQGIIRALGMAVVVIGWLYLFGGRSESRPFPRPQHMASLESG